MRRAWIRWLSTGVLIGALAGAALAAESTRGFGGGGPGFGLFMPDLAEINAFVEAAGFPAFDGELFLVGGGGRGGAVPGPVFGGAGWGAWIESERGGLHAEYGLGLGGFDMGFAVGGSDRSVLTFGALMGGGGAEVILTEFPQAAIARTNPRGIVPEPARQTYDCGFVLVALYLDAQIQLLDWMGLGVRAGYVLSLLELNGGDEGPLDAPALAPRGPYVRFSVVFGGMDRDRRRSRGAGSGDALRGGGSPPHGGYANSLRNRCAISSERVGASSAARISSTSAFSRSRRRSVGRSGSSDRRSMNRGGR